MAPKRPAGAGDETAVRKICQRFRDGETTEQAAAADDIDVFKKCKLSLGDSTGLEVVVGEDSTHRASTPACNAVLGTPELLDAILSLLPVREVQLYIPRVCKQWKDAISASPKIQTKLWYRSPSGETLSPEGSLEDHPLAVIGQLKSEYPGLTFSIRPSTPWYDSEPKPKPFLITLRGSVCPPLAVPTILEISPLSSGLPTCYAFTIRNIKPNFDVVQPSWLDMYLTEPPTTTARLSVLLPDPEHLGDTYHYAAASVREPGGLTFRAVLNVLDKVCQSSACRLAPYHLRDPSRAWCRVDFFCGTASMRDDSSDWESFFGFNHYD